MALDQLARTPCGSINAALVANKVAIFVCVLDVPPAPVTTLSLQQASEHVVSDPPKHTLPHQHFGSSQFLAYMTERTRVKI